jgi:dipeptidyl aminopeptidase/acylaminoacyl peptidase
VTEAELRNRLLGDALPGEVEAGQRSWEVVRAAYATRERVPWIERHSRALIALAVIAALAVAAVTPPGRALVESVRDKVAGETPTEPALFRLPTGGRLLVESAQGAWVARQDGSKRRLGAYEAASWSPRGLFVVATRRHQVVALEPDKTDRVRWTVTRPGRVTDARWAPSGFRVAYREDDTLRVVAGNGEDDRLLIPAVAPVAPAWRPGTAANILAYAAADGSVHVVDVDTREELWSTPAGPTVTHLVWSGDGRRLLALSLGERQRIFDSRGNTHGAIELAAGHVAVGAAFAPAGDTLAYIDFDLGADGSALVLAAGGSKRTVYAAEGRLEDVAWSPNGRWLLVTFPAADQWVFLRTPGVRGPVTVSHITREFDPGGTGLRPFPRIAGWIE